MMEDEQLERFLDTIYERYGYDFRAYSRASIKRRTVAALQRANCRSLAELTDRVLVDPTYYREVVSDLTVNVTEMFRDPGVYRAIRSEVVPILRTYPSIRIWLAGCATGEEVYSMAILLKEEGLLERSFLYGTDLSPRAIAAAERGVYSAAQIQTYTVNYQKSGGLESFADYYRAEGGGARIDPSLKRHILFSQHNLASDEVFSEVQLIFCRNVLIYFSSELQSRALELMRRALVHRGILVLGNRETVDFTDVKDSFEILHRDERIYKKI